MPAIPTFLLKKLYVQGSLRITEDGFSLTIKNTLMPGTLIKISPLQIDGVRVEREQMSVTHNGVQQQASAITPAHPLHFNLNDEATLYVAGFTLRPGRHVLAISVTAAEVGELKIQIEDQL